MAQRKWNAATSFYKEMIVRIYENFYNESKKELEEQGFKFADKLEEE